MTAVSSLRRRKYQDRLRCALLIAISIVPVLIFSANAKHYVSEDKVFSIEYPERAWNVRTNERFGNYLSLLTLSPMNGGPTRFKVMVLANKLPISHQRLKISGFDARAVSYPVQGPSGNGRLSYNFIIVGPLQFALVCGATDGEWVAYRPTFRKLIASFHIDEKRIRAMQGVATSQTSVDSQGNKRLQDFNGVYVGVMPSDASSVRMGEIEMNIHCNGLTARIATGDRIEVVERRCEDYVPMNTEEIKREFAAESPYASRIRGFRYKDGSWPVKLLFLNEPQYDRSEYGMVVRSEQTDMLGLTVLLSPAQIKHGAYQRFISDLEKKLGKKPASSASIQRKANPFDI